MFAMVPTRPYKFGEFKRARELRRGGMSLKKIATELGVAVSSVSSWTSDITLTQEQQAALLLANGGPWDPERLRAATAARSATCLARREEAQAEGRLRARTGDPLHRMGCMLYWAEGRKSRNTLQFSNSDPHMMRLFRRFLSECIGADPGQMRVTLNVYTNNGMTIEEIERYWLELLDLPASCVRKHTLDHMPTSSSGRAKNKLPFGVCTLRVHNTWMLQHIYGAIQEYGGFDELAWLR
jgi:transcriptional regulator with XRE-family HTH domain